MFSPLHIQQMDCQESPRTALRLEILLTHHPVPQTSWQGSHTMSEALPVKLVCTRHHWGLRRRICPPQEDSWFHLSRLTYPPSWGIWKTKFVLGKASESNYLPVSRPPAAVDRLRGQWSILTYQISTLFHIFSIQSGLWDSRICMDSVMYWGYLFFFIQLNVCLYPYWKKI